jgi:hypothetical protein
MRKILFFILIAGAWLDGHARSLPQCPEEKPFYEWSGCVGIFNYGESVQYVGEFAAGGPRGRGALISEKGYALVDGRWVDGLTVEAAGGRWRYVANADGVYFFVLMSSIKQEGALRRAWVMRTFREPDAETKWLSGRELTRFDCSNERYQQVQSSLFSGVWGDGELLDSFGESKWKYFQPGTVYGNVAEYACGYKLASK